MTPLAQAALANLAERTAAALSTMPPRPADALAPVDARRIGRRRAAARVREGWYLQLDDRRWVKALEDAQWVGALGKVTFDASWLGHAPEQQTFPGERLLATRTPDEEELYVETVARMAARFEGGCK